MVCESVRNELVLIALGEESVIPPPVIDHLAACASCRTAYRSYVQTVDRLALAVPRVELPPHLREAILSKVRASESQRRGVVGREQVELGTNGAASLAGAVLPAGAAAPAGTVPSSGTAQKRAWLSRLAARGSAWVSAALVLAALNGFLLWNSVTLNRKLDETNRRSAFLQAELTETWRAFSSAPAEYAGVIDFGTSDTSGPSGSAGTPAAPGESQAQVTAMGYLYQRPNGWAALIQVRGLEARQRGVNYLVWMRDQRGWTEAGPLLIDGDGVGSFIYYAREPELAVQSVRVVPEGVMPGTPRWSQETLVAGRVVPRSATAPEDGGTGSTSTTPSVELGENDW